MTTLRTKSFAELLDGYSTAVQASSSGLVDFSVGSILRACGEAIGQTALWLQGLILALLAGTRASTSTGADLDTWMADFGFVRTPALKAAGNVTFTRLTTTGTATVLVGATVETTDGTQEYEVVSKPSDPNWNGSTGFTLANGVGSITVPVRATTAGAAGNARKNTVKVITSAMPGIDTVDNAAKFSGGADVETDAAFRSRFIVHLSSLSRATPAAVGEAVLSVQPTLNYTIKENENPDGTSNVGFFYVVVDDGSGNTPDATVNAVTAAVELVRPIGTTFSAQKATKVTANITFKVGPKAGFANSVLKAKAVAAVTAYVNSLKIGETLRYTRIAQVAYDSHSGIANIKDVTINAGTADVTATTKQVIRAGTVTASNA